MTTRTRDWRVAGSCTVLAAVWLAAATSVAAPPRKPQSEFTIRTAPVHAMLPPGGKIGFRVSLEDRAGQPVAGELQARVDPKTSNAAPSTLKLQQGTATFTFQVAAGMQPGIHNVEFRGPDKSIHTLYVDVLDQADYDRFAQATQKVRFQRLPVHLLFIGDSLTDQLRGQNYVDKLAFWLEKQFGTQTTVRNAGVGGDYISRVWDRLNKDPKVNRPEMYENLYTPSPTHIFFFLGHNDSKLKSDTNYTVPVVLPEQFEAFYRQSIQKVQKETGARIVVLSSTSSVYEITKATSEKRLAQGKANNLFGKPEALEQFNALALKAARECGADYLDVYEPTRRHPDKPTLFSPDGVHLSNLGNRLLAMEILKHLGSQQRAGR